MLETTTTPMTLDVWTAGPLPLSDEVVAQRGDGSDVTYERLWDLSIRDGLRDCIDSAGAGNDAWLVHGVINVEEVEEIDVVEDWVIVDPARVRIDEVIALRAPVAESAQRLLDAWLCSLTDDEVGD